MKNAFAEKKVVILRKNAEDKLYFYRSEVLLLFFLDFSNNS